MVTVFSDLDLSILTLVYLMLLILLTIAPFLGIGLFAASFVLAFKQGDPVNYLLSLAITLFAGVLFPITVLPAILQGVSGFIPTTYSLDLIRKVIISDSVDFVSQEIVFYLLLSSVVCLIMGIIVMKKTLAAVKLFGTSGRY